MKAIITNNVNGRSFQIQRETREELDAFIQYQKAKTKCPWGEEGEFTIEIVENPVGDVKNRLNNAEKMLERYQLNMELCKKVEAYYQSIIAARGLSKVKRKKMRKNKDIKAILEELRFGDLKEAARLINKVVEDKDIFFESDLKKVSQFIKDLIEVYK